MKPWRGHVHAEGLWLDPTWGGPPASRLVEVWRPGSSVFAVEGGLFVRWPEARRLAVASAAGLPVVLRDGALLAADTRAAPHTVSVPVGGQAITLALSELPAVDLASLLDLGVLRVDVVEPLGDPPPVVPRPRVVEVRRRLGIGDGTDEAEAARAAMASARPPWWAGLLSRWLTRPEPASPGKATPVEAAGGAAEPATPAWAGRLLGALFGVGAAAAGGAAVGAAVGRGWWARLFGSSAGAPARPGGAVAPERGPAWWERLAARLGGPLLSAMFGQRFSRWFDELLDLFQSDRFEDALRRAIPLGGEGSGPSFPGFSLPGMRAELRIGGARGAGRGLSLADGLYARLRQEYERAARRLETSGRIDEAAFVHIELLRDVDAGLLLLETHGRFATAAEIAEARDLPAERAIRLWILADQPHEAMRIARIKGAFVSAILLLRDDPERARELRRAWASLLRRAGQVVAAAEVLRADEALVPEARRLAVAATIEDPSLFSRLAADVIPTLSTPDAESRFAALVRDDTVDGPFHRAWAAEGLEASKDPRTRALGTRIARALVVDAARQECPVPITRLRRTLGVIGGQALQADLPADLGAAAPGEGRLVLRSGSLARPSDVLPVLESSVLAAWGEAGVLLYDARGRVRRRFDVPATQLVADAVGEVAIAIVEREGFVVAHRLDLRRGAVTTRFEAPLRAWAADFDGGMWFVHDGNALSGIDLLSPAPRALWRVDRLEPGALTLHPEHLTLATKLERFCWRGRDLRLISRADLPKPEPGQPSDASGWVWVSATSVATVLKTQLPESKGSLLPLPASLTGALTVAPAAGATIVRASEQHFAVVHRLRTVEVSADAPAHARVVGRRLAVACGDQVTVFALDSGRVHTTLRVGGG